MQPDAPEERPSAPVPPYQPPKLTVLGTLGEITMAGQPGGSPDLTFNASP